MSKSSKGKNNSFSKQETKDSIERTLLLKYGVTNISKIYSKNVSYKNEIKTACQWSKILNMKISIIGKYAHARINGFSY